MFLSAIVMMKNRRASKCSVPLFTYKYLKPNNNKVQLQPLKQVVVNTGCVYCIHYYSLKELCFKELPLSLLGKTKRKMLKAICILTGNW